LFSSMIERCP